MSTQPLFYKNVVPLSKERHSDYSVEIIEDYRFARETNSLYIAAVEFLKASREYPIVFTKGTDNTIFPVVILGMQNKQNLYVDHQGQWSANYIPAYVRRYPFILANSRDKEGNFAVCIDESYPGFNNKQKGQRLFNAQGEESEILKQSVEFLKEYQNHTQLTTLFSNNINELGILEPMHANIELKNGERLALSGFLGINREKLKALAPETLSGLVNTDQMELIYAHLSSLDNIETLIQRLDNRKIIN